MKLKNSFSKYIATIYKAMGYYLYKEAEKYNLKKHHLIILFVLYNHEGITQSELKEILMLDEITVTKRLKGLVEKGYIEKEQSKNDKRKKELYITEKGYEIQEELNDIHERTNTILTQGVSKEEEKITKQVLKKMSENIYEFAQELRKNN